jgi:uncharacterized repeat protein (TIGR01451 family)
MHFLPCSPGSSRLIRLASAALAAAVVAGSAIVDAQAPERPSSTSRPAGPTLHRLDEGYGRLPLHFETNAGQADARADFLARGRGYTLFLTPGGAVLGLTAADDTQSAVVRLNVVGANARAHADGTDPLPGRVNYFIGNDPAKWRTNIPTFGRVQYDEVYPGIDLAYYGNQGQLEFDFIVAPGADPTQIAMSFEGAESVQLDPNGDLVLRVSGGDVRQHRPVVYQDVDGARRVVEGRYVMKGARQVGFDIGAYATGLPLIIDPILVYSTYLGTSAADQGNGIAVDAAGSTYVTGRTGSTLSPFASTGAFQTVYGGGSIDAFVAKLSADGAALVYATYLGGGAADEGLGIAVDVAGNAYVTGMTGATAPLFPSTPGSFDSTHNGGIDAFVAKLDPTGAALLYSGFLGTSGTDEGQAIAVDAAGNAYVTGPAAAGFSITPGAFDSPSNAGIDAFVAKINPTGSMLVYATLLGGGLTDQGNAIAVDGAGNAYVTGQTFSGTTTPFPTSPGAYDTTRGGSSDAFVTKVNATGSGLVFSTYLGGNEDDDIGRGIALDALLNVYLTGQTFSGSVVVANAFPTTTGALDATLGGTRDAFVTVLNAEGTGLLYSTYLGGDLNEDGTAIAVDAAGHVHLTGQTASGDFPTAAAPGSYVDTALAGSTDAFVTTLNPAGGGATDLVYSTYLGGTNGEGGTGITVDGDGNAYVTGFTNSTVAQGFPIIAGSFDAIHNGANDAFIVKLGTLVLTLTLDPADAINNLATEHCATGLVEDQLGNPVLGVTVYFTVTGAVTTNGSDTTDASGQATFCYVGPATAGADVITAYPDANSNAVQDPSEPTATATKTWADQFETTTAVTSTSSATTFGAPVTLTATVTASIPVTEGTVTFQDGATVLAGPIAVDAVGQASFTISTLSVGSHTITASYSGTATFTASTGSIVHTVNTITTQTAATSSPNPSTYGHAVELTATVAPTAPGVPTGSVTFFDGSIAPQNAIGTSALDSSGHAVLVISTLAAADHSIRAVYNGDAAFNASTSPVLIHTVTAAATTTTLSSSLPSPTVFGETVTFTAFVDGPGVEIPTGTVAFSDGMTLLGTATVDARGEASIALSSLAVGSHTIHAVYTSANTNFTGSTAAPLAHDAGLAPTTTTVTSAPNPSVYSEAVTITAAVAAVAPGAYTLAFAAPASVAAGPGTGTFAVASGDFDGDGIVDLVSANRTSNNVSVVLGNGDGTFGPPAFFGLGTGTSPSYVIAADLDGDGNLDLVTTNEGSSNVSVLAGNGDGTFGAAANFSTPGAGGASAVALGEFNGDGLLDLAVSNSSTSNITVRDGNGMLDFTPGSNFGVGARPLHVMSGHLSPDTALDLATANFGPGTVTLKINDGAGNFGAINTAPMSPGVGPVALVLADFNGDGKLDLATANRSSGDVTVRLDLTPNPPITGPATSRSLGSDSDGVMARPEYLVGADFNGDRRLDLAVTDSEHTYVRIMTGTGGSFEFPQTFTTDVPTFPFASNAPGRRFIAADLNGDGRTDLAFPTLGDDVKVLLNTGVGPTGLVQFFDDGTPIGVPVAVVNGTAALTTSTLAVGTHTLTAQYASDGNYAGSAGNTSHVVARAQTTTAVTSSVNPSVFGQPATFTATVAAVAPGVGTPTGLVEFRDNGTLIGSAAVGASGHATFATSTLAVGPHTMTAEYLGDGNFLGSTGSVLQTVNKTGTTTAVTSSVNPSVFGQTVTFTATVAALAPSVGTPAGMVELRDNGTLIGSAPLDGSGQATFEISTLVVGAHTMTAEYLGDGDSLGSTGALAQIVNRASTTTAVTSSVNPSVHGQSVTLTATVSALAPGAGTPSGSVQFLDNGTSIGAPVALSGGVATMDTSALAVGPHTITAEYSGDGNFLTSTGALDQTVNKASSTTVLTSSANPSVFGQPVTFTATVTAAAPGAGTPGGSVRFLDNGTPMGAAVLLVGGVAMMTTATLSVGTHTITAEYSGDGNFLGSTGSLDQAVNKASSATTLTSSLNPSVYGQPVTFTATVSAVAPGAGAPSGSVQFLDNGTPIGIPVLLVGGVATMTTATLSVGSHAITAEYSGDGTFLASTGSVVQTVNKIHTTTPVTSSVNSAVSGQSVTFTATVSAVAPGSGTPSGSVQFLDNGTPMGAPVILSGGVATISTSALAVGSHTITGEYSGDDIFLASTGSVIQTVNKVHTTTVVTASVNPSASGQSVIFTATVSAVAPGVGIPSGSVQFLDSGTAMGGPVVLSGGVATIATATLSVGSHTIRAEYSGDGNFDGSAGTVTQMVNQAGNPVLTLTKSVDKTTAGPGDKLVYTLTYANTGTAAATGATIRDVVPASTTFVSASHGGKDSDGTVKWKIGDLAAGASGSVTLTVRISAEISCRDKDGKDGGHKRGDNDKDDQDHRFRRNGHYSGDRCAHDDDDHDRGDHGHHDHDDEEEDCAIAVTNKGTITSTQTPSPVSSNTVTTQVKLRSQAKPGRMTGGGTFGSPRVSHGFTLRCDLQGRPQKLEVNWRKDKSPGNGKDKGYGDNGKDKEDDDEGEGGSEKFHLEQLTSVTCLDDPKIGPRRPSAGFDTYRGEGTGRYNGARATAVWTFTDAGEPGRNDTASIVIKDAAGRVVLSASGPVSNGNHQAH